MQNLLLFSDGSNCTTAIVKKHVTGMFIDESDSEHRTLTIRTADGNQFATRYDDADTCQATFNNIILDMNKEPL